MRKWAARKPSIAGLGLTLLALIPPGQASSGEPTFTEGGQMSKGKVVHTSKISITRAKGTVRKALIEGFSEPIYFGVHGGIKKFYGVEPEEEHPATLDYIVAATGG